MSESAHDLDSLDRALAARDGDRLWQLLAGLPPGESGRWATRLGADEQRELLLLLAPEQGQRLLQELALPQAADMLRLAPAERAAAILQHYPSNDQADLLAELDDDAAPVLAALPPEAAQRVRRLGQYDPHSAGGLMIAEYLAYPDDATVADVVDDLRSHARQYAGLPAQYAYITDRAGSLTGVLRLRDLLLLDAGDSVRLAMISDPYRVGPDAPLDELLHFFDRHPLFAVPVVDAQGKLLGLVLQQDVEEADSARADRRLLLASGLVTGEEYRSMRWTRRVAGRAPWLAVSRVLSLVAASVIGLYQETLSAVIVLAVFLPVISGMGGNSGNQALGVSIRELSLGLVKPHEVGWVVRKELLVSLINGLLLGAALGALAYAWQGDLRLGMVVALAVAFDIVLAACLGGAIPLLLTRLGWDPALASGPILFTLSDLCGFLFALVLADAWLTSS